MSTERGRRYNNGKLRWHNIPHFMLKGLAEVGQYGESKYDAFNFLKGMPVTEIMNSLLRHFEQLESPFESDYDAESKVNHAYHIAWNALFLAYVLENKPHFDDRYKVDEKIENTQDDKQLKFDFMEKDDSANYAQNDFTESNIIAENAKKISEDYLQELALRKFKEI